jgi:hypothetical protein
MEEYLNFGTAILMTLAVALAISALALVYIVIKDYLKNK